jgi:hypothetical protein
MDPAGISTDFIYTLRDIIKANCMDATVSVDDLTILDKLFICIKLRINSIGPMLSISFNDILAEDKTPVKININLEDVYSKMLVTYANIHSRTISDDDGTYTILCDLPTIGDEYRLNKELQETLKSNLSDDDTVAMKQSAYAELFVQELIKFVKTMNIRTVQAAGDQISAAEPVGQEQVLDVDLRNTPFTGRIKILETLPYTLTEKILDYANETIKMLDSLLLVSVQVGDKTVEHQLEITNSDFFTRS